jgi:hypothetical protein
MLSATNIKQLEEATEDIAYHKLYLNTNEPFTKKVKRY